MSSKLRKFPINQSGSEFYLMMNDVVILMNRPITSRNQYSYNYVIQNETMMVKWLYVYSGREKD